jgi:hypothetical protein
MNRLAALAIAFVACAGCGSASYERPSRSSSSAPRDSNPPRVRCLSNPARDDASGSRPLFYLFCTESP